MCGIATIAIGRGRRGRIPYKMLQNLVRELMIEIQRRGFDASGLAIINEGRGKESKVFKKPLRADRLVVRPVFNETLNLIGPSTNFILLHSRATSVGSTQDNFNNHPIIVEPIVGIHNGTLFNDDRLFSRFSKEFHREGDVDSEIIFKLYNHFVDTGLSPEDSMVETGRLLYGAFTGALVDMRKVHQMVIFKNERVLSVFSIPYFDIVITVSEASYYDRAAKRLKIKARSKWETLIDGSGLMFDLNLKGRLVENLKDFKIPVKEMHGNHGIYGPWMGTGLG